MKTITENELLCIVTLRENGCNGLKIARLLGLRYREYKRILVTLRELGIYKFVANRRVRHGK